MKETILAMERYAEANNVPIIELDSIKFIMKYIKMNNVKSVLEIGTAIGYSAILMANATSEVEITTIERDEKRYREAVKNVNACGLDKRIDIVYNDALEVNLAGHSYDLIFIDAAKGKNIFFFNKFKDNLNSRGSIITDNLSFHGLVENENLIKTKNQRGIVNKIKDYINFLDNNEEFITVYVPVGDTIAISKRRSQDE